MLRQVLHSLIVLCVMPWAAQAQQPVAVELVLAVDTSVSVDAGEYRLQMRGIAEAFRDPEIVDLIGQQRGGVVVTLVQWSQGHLNHQSLEWQHLSDTLAVFEFANAVENTPRRGAGRGTAIGDAIWFATKLIEGNSYHGTRRTIDISGDARSNSGASPSLARDVAVGLGITINGLVIEDGDRALGAYFERLVIGGEEAFVISVERRADFADAMRRKLARELGSVAALR